MRDGVREKERVCVGDLLGKRERRRERLTETQTKSVGREGGKEGGRSQLEKG